MQQLMSAEFHGTPLSIIDHAGQKWLTAEQVGRCLGYADGNARAGIVNLYNRNSDEFSETDTCVIKLISQGQARDIRIFSATGCNLLGFFASTPRAKEFRVWAKAVLAGQPTVMEPVASVVSDASMNNKIDRLLGLMEQVQRVIPNVLEATQPARGKPGRKRMYVEDVDRILALRDKGYKLDDLVTETEFSQSQCWSVISGRYKVLESGRVSIDLRSDSARQADTAARAERDPQPAAQ